MVLLGDVALLSGEWGKEFGRIAEVDAERLHPYQGAVESSQVGQMGLFVGRACLSQRR